MLTFFAMLAGMADPLRKMSDIFSNFRPVSPPPTAFSRGSTANRRSATRNSRPPSAAITAIWCSRTSASPISRTSRCSKT